MHDCPLWPELLRIEHAINQNGAREMMHRSKENPATDEGKVGVASEYGLHHLLDLRCRRHRRGLTSVTMIRFIPG